MARLLIMLALVVMGCGQPVLRPSHTPCPWAQLKAGIFCL